MSGTEVALGIVGSVSALYGFALAYYIFARTMNLAEREQHDQVFREAEYGKWQYRVNPEYAAPSETDFRLVALKKVLDAKVVLYRRTENLNWFLLGSTAAFVVSVIGTAWYLGIQLLESEPLLTAVLLAVGPIALAAMVAFVGAFVGYRNLRQTRDLKKKAKDQLKLVKENPSAVAAMMERSAERSAPPTNGR